MKWCSATHTSSKPASSAATAAATVESSTVVWSWPGNCAASKNSPNRMGGHLRARQVRAATGPSGDPDRGQRRAWLAVAQLGTLVEQLAPRGDERPVAGTAHGPRTEGGHPVAVLEGQLDPEVAF